MRECDVVLLFAASPIPRPSFPVHFSAKFFLGQVISTVCCGRDDCRTSDVGLMKDMEG